MPATIQHTDSLADAFALSQFVGGHVLTPSLHWREREGGDQCRLLAFRHEEGDEATADLNRPGSVCLGGPRRLMVSLLQDPTALMDRCAEQIGHVLDGRSVHHRDLNGRKGSFAARLAIPDHEGPLAIEQSGEVGGFHVAPSAHHALTVYDKTDGIEHTRPACSVSGCPVTEQEV